ncbi:MAG: electron transfer flavoprotein-ubiquinone oxidoreductase [Acidobacteria bacterium]|nr:electron transfer flavoprotein-ubiquinone oxidoreductase [Acidobacteriota bacterium]
MERDTLEVDVLIVGGGPAGLSAALRLAALQRRDGGEPLAVAVLEKSRQSGSHMLSGAVLDPSALDELLPDWKTRGAPVETLVRDERIYYLTERSQLRSPYTPPGLRNHGNYIISLNRFVRWLSEQAEADGADIFTGFAGTEVLYEGDRVVGVRTGDRGIDKHGERKGTFEPGVDIKAAVTIFADGVRGNLTKTLIRKLGLDGPTPQTYAIGIKELWEIPPDRVPPGRVVHTMGYPLRNEEFGGGFIYALPKGRLALGFVVGLDYRDPLFDPHMAFQRFKQHPLVSAMLAGGQMTRYGAKALPEGGWHAIPRCHVDGALIIGDAAGFMNSMRLKGIHLAMKSGICAADTAFDAVRAGDVSVSKLATFQRLVNGGSLRRELYPVRNVHQAFGAGLFAGGACFVLAPLTGGWWPRGLLSNEAGHERMTRLARYYRTERPDPDDASNAVKVDRTVTFDKLTNVHYSGTRHDEDQPVHLLVADTDVCRTRCREEYGNPCVRFCPAHVYEMVDDGTGNGRRLQINASNCVHCKTCDIMDPYQIIDWVPPEGGGGPEYEGM